MKKTFIFVILMFGIISTLSYSTIADKLKGLSPQQIENKMKELLVEGKTDENEEILREYIEFLCNYEIPDKYIEKNLIGSYKYKENDKNFPKANRTFNSLGYKLEVDDEEYIAIDYNKLIKKYGEYVSKKFLDYLVIMATDKMYGDAEIIVEYDDIFKYILKCDEFLIDTDIKYKEEADKIEQFRRFLIIMYFIGLNNTPVFEWETKKITDEKIIKSYKNSIKNYGETKTGKMVQEYYNLLIKSRFYETKEVKLFLDKNKIGFEFEETEE